MAITEDKIRAVRERVDIVDLIAARVPLKKAGSRYVGLCPFHHEKTGSFSVSREKSLFYCFGCHASGDIFNFVMLTEGLDFPAAVQRLADQVGVELQPPSPAAERRQQEREQLSRANMSALEFFEGQLAQGVGRSCQQYMKGRGISVREAKMWRLGFGGERGALVAYLRSQDSAREHAVRAGLLTEDGERSLFDGRLVFPIFTAQGQLAGFGGRRIEEASSGPKYINTRESALFEKRRLLYGMQQAQDAIRRSRCVVLVEGYTDVLAAHRAGVNEAVAALGTAFSPEHAKQCARVASHLVLLLDADPAGRRAAMEAAQLALGAGLRTRVASLSDGDDPDSLVRRRDGKRLLKECVEAARPAAEYFIDALLPQGQAALSVEERAQAAQTLAPLLASLGSGLERDLYTERLAERVGVTPEQLRHHWNEAQRNEARRNEAHTAAHARSQQPRSAAGAATPAAAAAGGGQEAAPREPAEPSQAQGAAAIPVAALGGAGPATIELEMLRELLLYPELRPRYETIADYALTDAMRLLLTELAGNAEACVAEVLATHVRDPRWLGRLTSVAPAAAQPNESADDINRKAEQTYHGVLQKLKWRHVDAALRDVICQLREVENSGGDTSELIRRKHGLTRQKVALRRRPAAA